MFITFEGIDFSGKSTQCARAVSHLGARGHAVDLLREPGGTDVSEAIRGVLLDTRYHGLDPVAELLLFSAARAQLVRERIRPALAGGRIVVADRFLDSTTVYQGFGRGIDRDAIGHVHALATDGLLPDLTILIDITVEESLARRAADGRSIDRMESADGDFFRRVREGYLTLAAGSAGRVQVLDGMRPVDVIASDVREMLDRLLEARA
jgi:dTMP kinase